MAPRSRAWVPKAGREWFLFNEQTAEELVQVLGSRAILTRQEFVSAALAALKAPTVSGSAPSDTTEESSGSPFRPVCIWPNIRKWTKNDDTGEWNDPEEYECPIRVEDRMITATELSKNHCTKCPIFRTFEIKEKRKARSGRSRRAEEPGVRGVPVSGPYRSSGGGFNAADAFGWGSGR